MGARKVLEGPNFESALLIKECPRYNLCTKLKKIIKEKNK